LSVADKQAEFKQESLADWEGMLAPVWFTDTYALTYLPFFRFSQKRREELAGPLCEVTLVGGVDDFVRRMRQLAARSVYPSDARERLEGFLGGIDLRRDLAGFIDDMDLSLSLLKSPDGQSQEVASAPESSGRAVKITRTFERRTEPCRDSGAESCRRISWSTIHDPVSASQALADARRDEGKVETGHAVERIATWEVVRKDTSGPVVRIRRLRHSKENFSSGANSVTFLDHEDLEIRLTTSR
jgi:hypothetical protein